MKSAIDQQQQLLQPHFNKGSSNIAPNPTFLRSLISASSSNAPSYKIMTEPKTAWSETENDKNVINVISAETPHHKSVLRELSPLALDQSRVQKEIDELSEELEIVKNANIKLKFSFKSVIKNVAPPRDDTKENKCSIKDITNVGVVSKAESKTMLDLGFLKHVSNAPPSLSVTQPQVQKKPETAYVIPSRITAQSKMNVDSTSPLVPDSAYAVLKRNANISPLVAVSTQPKKWSEIQPKLTATVAPQSLHSSISPIISTQPASRGDYLQKLRQMHAPQKAAEPSTISPISSPKNEPAVLLTFNSDNNGAGGSLAENFLLYKGVIAHKYDTIEKPIQKPPKPPRTKEQILQQRKQMMKPKLNRSMAANIDSNSGLIIEMDVRKSAKLPPKALLERLAAGKKASVLLMCITKYHIRWIKEK